MRIIFKYFLLGIICLTNAIAIYSQQKSYDLNIDESGSTKTYIARDQIIMQPGFQFNASNGNNTFNAKIDPTLIFPPSDKTYATADGIITQDPTLGGVVGNIPGQFGISPTGGATYSIPIECPPGINGMKPNITLVYNSHGGGEDGPLGIGWAIRGLSAISSTSKSLYSNGKIDGLDLTTCATQYSFDGNNLFSNDAIYGGDGTNYYTENQTQAQIVSYGSIYNGTTRLGPEYFILTSKEGNVIEYRYLVRAGSSTTTAPYQWLISKITDPNGNYITFSYDTYGNKQAVIKTINYTGNAVGAQPFETIQFDYVIKTKNNVHYIAGLPVDDALFLNSIKVAYSPNDQTFTINNQYALNYSYYDEKYHLISVTEFDKQGNKKNPIVFNWGTNTINPTLQTCTIAEIGGLYQQIKSRFFDSADIDGDGFSDIIQVYKTKFDYITYPYNYIKVNNTRLNGIGDDLIQFGDLGQDIQSGGISITKTNGILVGEFNGDKAKTILAPIFVNENGECGLSLRDYKSQFVFIYPLIVSTEIPTYAIGDINNDGKDEIVVIEKKRASNHNTVGKILYVKKVDYSNELSSSDIKIVDPLSINIGSDPKRIFIFDFDNDGLKDILLVTTEKVIVLKNQGGSLIASNDGVLHVTFGIGAVSTAFNSNDYSVIKPGDFNGDGLMDFLLNEHCNNVWKIALNNGTGFLTPTVISNMAAIEEEYTQKNDDKDDCIIVDLNHDGKSDVVLVDAVYSYQHNIWGEKWGDYEHTNINWYTSTGNGFTNVKSITIHDETYLNNTHNTVGDFNADGNGELFSFDSNLYTGVDTINAGRIYYYNTNHNANKITCITDGFYNLTRIDYQFLPYTSDRFSSSNFYSIGTSSTYPISDLQVPFSCINRVITPNGIGGNSTTSYTYSGLKSHSYKGILGFSSIIATNALNDIKTISITEFDQNLYLPSKQTNENYSLSQNFKISKSETAISNSKNNGVFNSQLTQTIENNYLTNNIKTTDYLTYDAWGNPTHIRTTIGNDADKLIADYNETFGIFGSWCPNKTVTSTSTFQTGSEILSKNTSFDYDTKGNLTKNISDLNDVNQLTTEYMTFDVYGNPTVIKKTANGNTRTSSVTYNFGRFISGKTDELGQITTYDWDAITNLLKSETNRLGKTEYSYNSQGQLVETKYPDGKRAAKVFQWAGIGNSCGAKYFTYSEASGSGPAYVWYDALGRELVSESFGLNNQKITVFKEYLANGNLFRISDPTFGSSAQTWAATYVYDPYGRTSTITTHNGTTTSTYTGRMKTVTSPSGTIEQNLKSSGLLDYTIQNGKKVSFTYYPSGLTKTSTPDGGLSITTEYDPQGHRTKLIDPDAGTIESLYNGFGELVWTKQLMHNGTLIVATNNYAPTTGQLQNIERNGETTTYHYDNLNRLDKIEIAGKHTQSYTYDSFDRVTLSTEYVNDKSFTSETVYDALGREKRHKYPSGYWTFNIYDSNGVLTEVKDDNNRSIWKPLEGNARGQLTKISRGGKETTFGFDDRGLPTSIVSPGIINMAGTFNMKGNLEYRQDLLTNQKEVFDYDALNRLTCWDVFQNNGTIPVKENNQSYDESGNISLKKDLEFFEMKYGASGRPHALDSILGKPDAIPYSTLNVTYTDFNKIANLSEADKSYTLTYGVDDQRRKSVYQVGGVTKLTRYYLGDYEEEEDESNNVRKIHYLSGGAVLIQNYGKDSLLYGYSDYQGSLIALTDENGTVVEKYAYDPWGNRRDPADWTAKDTRTNWTLNRGYTGHEHLDAFAIINMNGRVYDPITGMFFSPDPQLQDPGNWINYNRYGYCYNNPLVYSDPSGEWIHILGGAIIGGVINWGIHGFQFNKDGLIAFGIGALAGGLGAATGGAAFIAAGGTAAGGGGFVAGAIGSGVGYIYNSTIQSAGNFAYFGDPIPTGKDFVMGLGVSMLTGGVLQGFNAKFNNRDFWSGTESQLSRGGLELTPIQPKPFKYEELPIELPEQLSHYTPNNPKGWTQLGTVEGDPIWLTPNSELSSTEALQQLSLKNTPNWRIDISTTEPGFDPSKIMYINTRIDPHYGQPGSNNIEVIYRGIIDLQKLKVHIYKLPF